MIERVAQILGVKARFAVLWPSEALREVLCPFTSDSEVGLAWRQGWDKASAVVQHLEEHRRQAMSLELDLISASLPVTITGHKENKKIATIKKVREYTGCGLKEAKALVESLPLILGTFPEVRAYEIAADLRAVGAIVHVPSAVERLSEAFKEM